MLILDLEIVSPYSIISPNAPGIHDHVIRGCNGAHINGATHTVLMSPNNTSVTASHLSRHENDKDHSRWLSMSPVHMSIAGMDVRNNSDLEYNTTINVQPQPDSMDQKTRSVDLLGKH